MRRVALSFAMAAVCASSGCTRHTKKHALRDASPRADDADAGTLGPNRVEPRDASQTQAPSSAGPATRRDASGADAGAPDRPEDAGSSASMLDRFGVRKLNPTAPGGREWFLPDDAVARSDEWNVESNRITRVADGVFHTVGNNGEVRLSVASPRGLAWWRNVELTGYFRYTAPMDSNGQERHWELLARSERHAAGRAPAANINSGVVAPTGTSVWPGYPFSTDSVAAPCLGTSYHGNFYLNGQGLFEKEISHIAGYATQRAKTMAEGFADPMQRWFGLKFIVRNADADKRIHLELWLDAKADGNWQLLTQTDDKSGSWSASDASLDGCTAEPFSYQRAQLLSWAGPWVIFRSDSIAMDFRWLSAREIGPL